MDFNDKRGNLGDIMVGNEVNNGSKSKKMFFMALALIVLVALLAIVTWALLSKGNTAEENIANEQGLEQVDGALSPNNETFQNMPLQNDDAIQAENDKFDQIVRDIKAKQAQGQLPPAPESVDVGNKPATPAPKPATPAKTAQAPKQPAAKSTPAPKPAVTTTPKASAPAQNDIESTFKNVDVSKNGFEATKGHYLQVGAFSATPNRDFVNKISKYGYRIQTINLANGSTATRYLIGPYDSRTEANRDILQITTEITKPVYYEVK